MEQTILKTLDYKLFHFNDTTGESDDTNIVCLDEIHPFGQYLWEMLQVGCLDWHSLNYKQVWYICDHIASVMASDMLNEFRKLEITFQESLKQTVSVIMKTVHEEKARIETGKRTSLQRKFTRPPFQNVALNFMTNVCRLKITFANQRIEMKLSQTNAPFFHADETNKIAYSNVVTRAAAKRLRSSDQEKNDVFEDRSRQNVQYLIKRRKMQLSQHQSLIKSHNSSSFTCHNPNSFGKMDDSDDLVSQMIANRKKRILFCQGVTKWGKRCTRRPCHNSKYCNKHKQQK